MYYVYGIKNLKDNKYYIGITEDVAYRFSQHINYGLRGFEKFKETTPAKKCLYVDIYSYGINNFLFKVLEIVNTPYKQQVYDIEEKWIRHFNSVENGYNTVYNAKSYLDETTFETFDYVKYSQAFGKEKWNIWRAIKNNGEIKSIKNDKKFKPASFKDGDSFRYCYLLKLEEKIILAGTRKADNEENVVKKVKKTFQKRISENSEKRFIDQFIIDNGGLDACEIEIIYKRDKEDDEYRSFLEEFKLNNHEKFIERI